MKMLISGNRDTLHLHENTGLVVESLKNLVVHWSALCTISCNFLISNNSLGLSCFQT